MSTPKVLLAASIAAAFGLVALALAGQSEPYRAPRAADGHPDLNGIWQAVNTANYDLETHMARPAMALRDGPEGAVPVAVGIATEG